MFLLTMGILSEINILYLLFMPFFLHWRNEGGKGVSPPPPKIAYGVVNSRSQANYTVYIF